MSSTGNSSPGDSKLSRRELLRLAGTTGTGLVLGAGGYSVLSGVADAAEVSDVGDEASALAQTVDFNGLHQAGIDTAQQEHLHFASLDLITESASEVRDLLREWSEAGTRMTKGEMVGDDNRTSFLPPDDTGEAFSRPPSRLTLTFGFGLAFFEKDGEDRFGLAKFRPEG